MVSGVADFVGLLLACSGALLVAGPIMIWYSYEQNVSRPFGNQPNEVLPFAFIHAKWYLIWILYYWIVVSGALLLAWSRRGTTVVYNVEPDRLQEALQIIFDGMGLASLRSGRKIALAPSNPVDTAAPDPFGEPRQATLRVEPFPTLCNVTLYWEPGSHALRADIEDALRERLEDVRAADNPATTWFLGMATILFGLISLVIIFLVLYLPRRL